MAGKWDKYGEPENAVASFLSIEPGESQVVEYLDVDDKTFPVGTFPNQKDEITVPSVKVINEDGVEVDFDLLNTTARNAFLKLKPEPGTPLFIANHGKPRGKGYVLWTVRKAREGELSPGSAAEKWIEDHKPKAQAVETPAPKPVEEEPNF